MPHPTVNLKSKIVRIKTTIHSEKESAALNVRAPFVNFTPSSPTSDWARHPAAAGGGTSRSLRGYQGCAACEVRALVDAGAIEGGQTEAAVTVTGEDDGLGIQIPRRREAIAGATGQ